jgi:glycosyltransferase involved in cell wall biosynthesis
VGQSPHVLYVVDQLCQLGGAERAILQILRRLPSERYRASVVTFQIDEQLEELRNFPCPLHVLPLRRTYDLNAVKMAGKLNQLLKSENVSIVHTFFETSDIWAAPIAKWSGTRVLVSSRRDLGILRSRKHNLAYPIVNRLFDRVLAVSEQVRFYCIDHDHIPPEKVLTLYNGVDLDEIGAQAREREEGWRTGIPSGVPIISTVANIRRVKGIDVLLDAAAIVCQKVPVAVFAVAGAILEEQTFAELQEQVAALQLRDNFRFIGKLKNPFPLLRASAAFCLPSRSEGFSNALIEAMACGLPCVATRVGGNGEALEDGKNGYLVTSGDADEMAGRILQLLGDSTLAQRLGQAARETVETRFSMSAMMNRLMSVYDELLATRNASS